MLASDRNRSFTENRKYKAQKNTILSHSTVLKSTYIRRFWTPAFEMANMADLKKNQIVKAAKPSFCNCDVKKVEVLITLKVNRFHCVAQ